MNILFTGSTGRQTKETISSRALDRINDPSIIRGSLRKLGHVVTCRSVTHGEDLTEFDLVIVGLGQFGSMNYSGEIMNALYAIGAAPKVLVLHEDWKIESTMGGLLKARGQIAQMAQKVWSNGSRFYGGTDHAKFDPEVIEHVVGEVLAGAYPCMVPAFDWGDKSILHRVLGTNNVFNMDLTPYVLDGYGITAQNTSTKSRTHMLASLGDFRSWVKRNKLTWPVSYFGCTAIPGSVKLDSELDVFNECGKHWSILCPEYGTAGSGWFRIRYIYSALQGCTIHGSDKDLLALGIEPRFAEELSDLELQNYADEQRTAILNHAWTKSIFDERLDAIVREQV
jgi:hypothetical protein